MRKSILIFILLSAKISFGQLPMKEMEVWLAGHGYLSYYGHIFLREPVLQQTKIALVGSIGDTTWFEQSPKFRRFAFNPAELIPESSPKPRFAIGDSVSFMPDPSFSYYWLNAKVLDYSTNQRYLLSFQLENLEGRKTKTQRWVDGYLVESYANVKKK